MYVLKFLSKLFICYNIKLIKYYNFHCLMQPESDGSRSGSSLSLRGITGPNPGVNNTNNAVAVNNTNQSPSHRGVHRSISATNSKPNRRASSGGETSALTTNHPNSSNVTANNSTSNNQQSTHNSTNKTSNI